MSFQLKGEVLNFKCIVWKFQIKTFEKLRLQVGQSVQPLLLHRKENEKRGSSSQVFSSLGG